MFKKGTSVQIISGKDKGRKGKVLEYNQAKNLLKVEGIAMKVHFEKQDGLSKKEAFIHASNVKLAEA